MREWLKTWPSWLYDAESEQFTIVGKLLLSIALILVSYLIIKLITHLLRRAFGINKHKLEIDRSAQNFFVQTLKIVLWLAVAFVVVQILGIDPTSFAGILSAITVALGLSLQDIITSFASGLIILNQRHITTGDYIEVKSEIGHAEGWVERIHLMSTTIRTYDGQYITIANSNVRKAIVTNYSRYKIRRIFMTVPVSYEANPELVKKVLMEIVKADKRILKDPAPDIHYNELSNYSVRVAIKIWMKFDDYWPVYNSIHEKILLAFKKNKIKIPKLTNIEVVKDK
ncbi:MAG: mechanosensitive ion channel family protein [Bacilli bacterium]|nr:mechanosensitive ion channel family protein [Bacilli bacterium]